MIFSLRMNAKPYASVQDCFEITREAMKDSCVRDMKAQVGEPRIVAICHRESYGRGTSVIRSTRELLISLTSLVQHDTFRRVHKFPTLLDPRSGVSISTLAAENIDCVEHHHIRSLRLLQTLMTPDFIE